jgi:nucleoside-diphosphate-sugar epimerase
VNVLLTGATGFIGSHVARLLVREGCEVHALVRPSSDPRRIEDVASQIHLLRCDLRDDEEVGVHLDRVRPELCIHLAWYAEPGEYLMSTANLDMLTASVRLASRLAAQGCRRFVGAGSCFEYELSGGNLSETGPSRPDSLYAATKAATGMVIEQLGKATGMEAAWVRLFYQYGPFEDERRLVPSVILSLLRGEGANATKGEQKKDYLHVEDVASAIWAVAQSPVSGAVNIGSGKPVAVRDIVTMAGEIVGRPELVNLGAVPYRESEPMFVCADNRLLMENTTWSPRYGLREGLERTVEWWRGRLS